jgi:hypothetical protein
LRKKRDFEFYTGVGIGDGEATVAEGCSICGFIMKKAIVINSAATQITTKPIKTIVRNAPTISSRDAVENKPTLDFAESVFRDRLAKNAETIRKTHIIASTANIAPTKAKTVPVVTFEVFGAVPVYDESVDQLPFQPG